MPAAQRAAPLDHKGRRDCLVIAAPAVTPIVTVAVTASSTEAELSTTEAMSEVATTAVAMATVSITITAATVSAAAIASVAVLDGLYRGRRLSHRRDTERCCRGRCRCQKQTGSHQASTERERLEHWVSPCGPTRSDRLHVPRSRPNLNGVHALSPPLYSMETAPIPVRNPRGQNVFGWSGSEGFLMVGPSTEWPGASRLVWPVRDAGVGSSPARGTSPSNRWCLALSADPAQSQPVESM